MDVSPLLLARRLEASGSKRERERELEWEWEWEVPSLPPSSLPPASAPASSAAVLREGEEAARRGSSLPPPAVAPSVPATILTLLRTDSLTRRARRLQQRRFRRYDGGAPVHPDLEELIAALQRIGVGL